MDLDNRQDLVDPIYQDILDDPYDITPKWEPVSLKLLNEPTMSIVDIHYFYAMEIAKLNYKLKQFKYKSYKILKSFKKVS